MAYKFIGATEKFGSGAYNNYTSISPTVIYLLSAPSTPDSVVQQAIEKAESGEKVTVADVKDWKAVEAELEAEKQRKFGMRLTERGFQRFGSTGNVTKWRGIGLLSLVNEVNEVNQKRQFLKNVKNDFSIGENSGISLTSLTSLTTPLSPVESSFPVDDFISHPPVEPRPPRPLVCTWRAVDGRLITKCREPDLQRDESGQVVCCANCGSVQP